MTAQEYLDWIKTHNPQWGESVIRIRAEALEKLIKNAFETGRKQGTGDILKDLLGPL
jgi:hypothetical protein